MKFSKNKIALIVAIAGIILIISSVLFVNFNNSKKQDNKVENIIYYDVTFDYGNNKLEKLEIPNGDTVNEPKVSPREGMVFLGWYLDDELYNFDSQITRDIKLIAKWQVQSENQIVVTFDSNGGSFIQPVLLEVGEKVTKPSDPKLNNYIFLGWYLNDELFDFDKSVSENIVLMAKWEKVKENNNSNNDSNNDLNNNSNNNSNNDSNNDSNSGSISKPDKVTGVYIKYEGSNSISISYNKSNNANIYEIYRSSDNSNYNLLGSATSLIYSLDNLDTSKNYYYKVRACSDNKVCGEFSDVVSVPAKIKAPSNIKFSGTYSVYGYSGQMLITFDSSDADLYYLYSSSVGVASNDMSEQKNNNTNEFNLSWDTKASQYKIVAKKSGTNYEMYSSSDVYLIPSIDIASGCNIDITQSKEIDGSSINYSYNYKYSWDSASNIDGYILKQRYTNYVFKSFLSNVNSYESTSGLSDLELYTYKKGTNYTLETHDMCKVSKNF